MAIAHGTFVIPGTHESLLLSPWLRQRQRTSVFGLKGEIELTGERTTRTIVIPSWIHNNFLSGAAVQEFLDSLEALAEAEEETLHETGNIDRDFEFVKFERWEQDFGPIPSIDLGWFVAGRMVFEQLSP